MTTVTQSVSITQTNSAATSTNMIPHLHRWISERLSLKGKTVLDYGAGKYETGKDFLESHGAIVYRYDPYNLPDDINHKAALALDHDKVDILICSNVLNVIQDDRDLTDTIRDISYAGCICYFTVYEGDRSGEGRLTSKGFQRNIKTADWQPILERYFSRVKRIGKVFKCL